LSCAVSLQRQTATDTAAAAHDTSAAAASTAASTHADSNSSSSSSTSSSAVQTWRQHIALLFELLTAAASVGMRSEAVATHIGLPLLKTLVLMCADSNACDSFPPLQPATATSDEVNARSCNAHACNARACNARQCNC
jgi:hypothetical protein